MGQLPRGDHTGSVRRVRRRRADRLPPVEITTHPTVLIALSGLSSVSRAAGWVHFLAVSGSCSGTGPGRKALKNFPLACGQVSTAKLRSPLVAN